MAHGASASRALPCRLEAVGHENQRRAEPHGPVQPGHRAAQRVAACVVEQVAAGSPTARRAGDGAQVVWFRDPDGNLLSAAQYA